MKRHTRVKVLRQQIVIVLADSVEQPFQAHIQSASSTHRTSSQNRDVRLIDTPIAKPARSDLVDDPRQRRALLLERHGVVHVLVAQLLDGGREVPEEEDVALADLLRDLDVRAVCAAPVS